MQFKALTALAVATLAVATPTRRGGDSCSTGPVQCCNSVSSSSDPFTSFLLSSLNVGVQGDNVPIGLQCSPVSVIGVGGGTCKSNVVCCQNNAVGGLISIGCVPINL